MSLILFSSKSSDAFKLIRDGDGGIDKSVQ